MGRIALHVLSVVSGILTIAGYIEGHMNHIVAVWWTSVSTWRLVFGLSLGWLVGYGLWLWIGGQFRKLQRSIQTFAESNTAEFGAIGQRLSALEQQTKNQSAKA